LTLAPWSATLTSFATSVNGFLQTVVSSFFNMASQMNMLWGSSVLGANINVKSTGFLGGGNTRTDKFIKTSKVFTLIAKASSLITSPITANTTDDTKANSKIASSSINLVADSLAFCTLLVGVGKMASTFKDLLIPTSSSISMNGAGMKLESPKIRHKGWDNTIEADPLAGLPIVGGDGGGGDLAVQAVADSVLPLADDVATSKLTVSIPEIKTQAPVKQETALEKNEGAHASMAKADADTSKSSLAVAKDDSSAAAVEVSGAQSHEVGARNDAKGAEAIVGAVSTETDALKTNT
jgi:hypothetical protein